MSLWEHACVEYLSGLEIEPKKQERQLLFKVSVIEMVKKTFSDQFVMIALIVV